MRIRHFPWLAAACAALLTLTACSGPGAARTDTAPAESAPAESAPAESAPASTASADATADLEALYWARQDSARMAFTEADVRFMAGMIGHHAQALIMSDLAPENDASPAVQRLAARIINAQKDEIASMQRWLRDRDQPVPEVHIDGLNLTIHMADAEGAGDMAGHDMSEHAGHDMSGHGEHDMSGHEGMDHGGMDHGGMDHGGMDHGGMDHASMPGMLTQAQLEELAAAQGADFDRLFLTYMIQHHQGAIIMVDELFATDGAALDEAAFKLASEINVDQTTEIERMKLMLESL